MKSPHAESAQRIRDHLRTLHSDADLRTWFDPLSLNVTESGILEVRFPHALFSRWFGKERRKRFEREVHSALDGISRVVYSKPGERWGAQSGLLKIKPDRGPEPQADAVRFTFDSFIYNRKNEFPVSMAREVASSAGNRAYIPFIICGKGSCGKTHLLRAMAAAMTERVPSGMYLGTVEELEALYRENPASFQRRMARHKAIFLDNGQNLNAFPELQQELVFIAEKFKERQKPFVLALDEDVDQTAFNPKLRARLETGLTVTVKKPDLDVRLRYAQAQCVANRIRLRKDVLLLLAQRMHNLPSIQGVIAKAVAYQEKSGKTVTVAAMEKLMAGAGVLAGKLATPDAIINEVAESFSLTPEDIMGGERSSAATLARQTAMYLCRELLGTPYVSLGAFFQGKNHATVMYACKKIEKISKGDKDMNKRVAKIRKKFLSAQ